MIRGGLEVGESRSCGLDAGAWQRFSTATTDESSPVVAVEKRGRAPGRSPHELDSPTKAPRVMQPLPRRAGRSRAAFTIDTAEFVKASSTRSRNKTDRVGAVEAGQVRNACPWSIRYAAQNAMGQRNLRAIGRMVPDVSDNG